MDGIIIGRVVLYFALSWSIFVSIKAGVEAYRTARFDFDGEETQEDKDMHKRAHLASLIGIAFVSLFMVFSYVWFDTKDTGLETDDRSIGIFLVLIMNLLWLFFINHFKQERKGKLKPSSWRDILKF